MELSDTILATLDESHNEAQARILAEHAAALQAARNLSDYHRITQEYKRRIFQAMIAAARRRNQMTLCMN